MRSTKFGIVLRVRDLTKCRAFYRDVLDLGNPVIDSNFQCVFAIGTEMSLCLEADHSDTPLPSASERMALVLIPGDAENVLERLEVGGWTLPEQTEEKKNDSGVLRFHDPEGNLFYIQYSQS